jgi:hypothetical protein
MMNHAIINCPIANMVSFRCANIQIATLSCVGRTLWSVFIVALGSVPNILSNPFSIARVGIMNHSATFAPEARVSELESFVPRATGWFALTVLSVKNARLRNVSFARKVPLLFDVNAATQMSVGGAQNPMWYPISTPMAPPS